MCLSQISLQREGGKAFASHADRFARGRGGGRGRGVDIGSVLVICIFFFKFSGAVFFSLIICLLELALTPFYLTAFLKWCGSADDGLCILA